MQTETETEFVILIIISKLCNTDTTNNDCSAK